MGKEKILKKSSDNELDNRTKNKNKSNIKKKKKSTKCVEVKTEDVIAIKTLVDVMKEFLGDINIELKQDKEMNERNDDNDEIDCDNNNDTNNNTDNDNTKSKDKDRGGIKIVAVDSTKTLMILIKLDAREFSTFKVSKPIHDIGINLTQLYKLIKSIDKDDILTISVDEEDTQMLELFVENEVENSQTSNRLKMLDIDKKSYKIPVTKFDVVITMDSSEFHKICKEMSQIAEYIEIICKSNSITITCKGDCSEKSKTIFTSDTNGIKIKPANAKKKTIVQGIFEVKHFVTFSKCSNLCNNILIYMKNDYPIFIKYTVSTLGQALLGLSPINDANLNNNFSDDDDDYSDDE